MKRNNTHVYLKKKWTQIPTDKQGGSQNLHYLYPGMGLKKSQIVGLRVFPVIKTTMAR